MKEIIPECKVEYWQHDMACCGDPLRVGVVADLICKKSGRRDVLGNWIDYDEDHHYRDSPDCCIRGEVVRIQSVVVKKYADEKILQSYDANNKFQLFDIAEVDGYEMYGLKQETASWYIITLKNVVERRHEWLEDEEYRGRYVKIEPGDEGKELFWDDDDECIGLIGTTDLLTLDRGKGKEEVIDLTEMSWHEEVVRWRNEYWEHVKDGYSVWHHTEWLEWWIRGYAWAKKLKSILPEDVRLIYGTRGQSLEVLESVYKSDEWCLSSRGMFLEIETDMTEKRDAGLYVPCANAEVCISENDEFYYKLIVNKNEHHIFLSDRVALCPVGQVEYTIGTITDVTENFITIKANSPMDTHCDWSIEVI